MGAFEPARGMNEDNVKKMPFIRLKMKIHKFALLSVAIFVLWSSCSDDEVKRKNEDADYEPDQFVTTWQTDNVSENSSGPSSITIATNADYEYNYEVDWDNDGVFDESGITGDVTHDFGKAGIYTIRIKGEFPAFCFDYYTAGLGGVNEEPAADNYKLISVDQWGTLAWKKLKFSLCKNMHFKAADIPDVSLISNMEDLFKGATVFNEPIGQWNTSKVYKMNGMFEDAASFNQPIGDWNVSNVTNMSKMFQGAKSFNQPIGDWDVANVSMMSSMFSGAIAFNESIAGWNVSKVINMAYMFSGASAFDQPLGNWDVSHVTDMTMMFKGTPFNQPIGNWNVSKVTAMSSMFWYASSFNQPIGDWDVSSVTSMLSMFAEATAFNQSLKNWDVSNVTNMKRMFNGANSLSHTNYDNLLLGWSALTLHSDVTLDASSKYCSNEALAARNEIISTYNWTINDGGRDASCE